MAKEKHRRKNIYVCFLLYQADCIGKWRKIKNGKEDDVDDSYDEDKNT